MNSQTSRSARYGVRIFVQWRKTAFFGMMLLSRGYVGYTIREPLYQGMGPDNSSEIRAAALNPLVDPINRRPENDLTVANYLGKDNTTISKHNKKIREQFEEIMKRNHCLKKSK